MSESAFRETFCIAPTHPALPGHFPGHPVVPGVVLLDRVAGALQRWRGQHIGGLAQVKFPHPLLPAQEAELELVDDGRNIRFTIAHQGVTIAIGTVEVAA
jgi:3-hydroxyacyl-[acyl-carrier-protein] dehydratase